MAILKDEKEIFDPMEISTKELKMRYLKEKILTFAQANSETKKE